MPLGISQKKIRKNYSRGSFINDFQNFSRESNKIHPIISSKTPPDMYSQISGGNKKKTSEILLETL